MATTDTTPDEGPVKAEVSNFIVTGTKTRRYRAWCDQHQDGYQGGKVGAKSWATKHNDTEHPEAAH